MKKTLTGLCIPATVLLMATSVAGQAQAADVNLYGYIDIGLVKQSGKTAIMDHGQNNWIGVKGSEKIDSDLSAIFNLQMRFSPDTGASEKSTTLFQGETTVGLSSKTWGTARLGRALTPLWAQKWVYDPWYDSDLMGSIGNYNGDFNSDGLATVDYNNYSRVSNAVYYSTPVVAGFSLHTEAEIEEAIGADTRSKGVSLNYKNGPLSAMLSYEKNHISDSINYAGASYNLGKFTLMGSYSQLKLSLSPVKVITKHIAATYMLGADTLRGGYGRSSGAFDANNKDKVTIGYNHPLSKRTNLYADLYREKITEGVNGVAVGMNHTF